MTVSMAMLGADIDHPECVAWDPGRRAIVCGTESGEVLWLDPADGAVRDRVRAGEGFIGGLAVGGDGCVYACDAAGRRVVRVDPDSRSATTWSAGPADAPFVLPNYPVFDAEGRLWVSDSGEWDARNGRIVAIAPGGGEATVASTAANGFTNGLAISPDGAWLWVAESCPPLISRLPIGPGGTLGTREVVVDMPRMVPDGFAFTDDGRLLISCYRPDAVFMWDGRALTLLVEDWAGVVLCAPTNVAFGGPDLGTLWAANLGAGYVTRIDAGLRGSPLRYPGRDR